MAGNENEEFFERLAAQAAPERIGEAVPRLHTAERRQVEWRPVSLEELVPDDHRVRAVWRFVEGLDLSALLSPIKSPGFFYSKVRKTTRSEAAVHA
jgi:hypothetical protein